MIIKAKIEKEAEFDLDKDNDLREQILEQLKADSEHPAGRRRKIEDFSFDEIHDAILELLADDISFLDMDMSEYDFVLTEVKEEEEV